MRFPTVCRGVQSARIWCPSRALQRSALSSSQPESGPGRGLRGREHRAFRSTPTANHSGVRCVRSRKFWELDLDDFVTDGVPDQIGDRVTIETPHEGSTMRLCRLNAHPESDSNVPIRLAFGQ